jgi:hypothetical protein
MNARAVSLVTVVLLWSAGARASSSKLLFLTASPPELDDDALAEAVTIYSRDLGLTLERRGEAPLTVTADSLGSVVALVRRSGVRLAFWYVVRHQANENGDVILYAVSAGAELTVTDLGSRNGTRINNGIAIAAHQPQPLTSHDRVQFGSVQTMVLDVRELFDLLSRIG